MAVTPPKPYLNPESMPWARFVTDAVRKAELAADRASTNALATNQMIASSATATETVINDVAEVIVEQGAMGAVAAVPEEIVVTGSTSGWTANGNPFATITLGWQGVETDVDGNPLAVTGYQIMASQRGSEVETRRNYSVTPQMTDAAEWMVLGTGTVVTPTPDGLQIDFPSATTDFVVAPFVFPAALEGESWVGSYSVTVPVGFPAVSLYSRQIAMNGGGTGIGTATGIITEVSEGAATTVESAALVMPATAAATMTSLENAIGAPAIPAGARIIVNFALHEKAATIGGYFDGDTPPDSTYTYAWLGLQNDSQSVQLSNSQAVPVVTVNTPHVPEEGVPNPPQSYTIEGLVPGRGYNIQIRAISVYGVPGKLSEILAAETPEAADVLGVPTAPIVTTKLGLVVVGWDGTFEGGAAPGPGFDYVYAEWAPTETDTFTPFGSQMGRAGAVNLTGRPVGSTVAVRLTAVDNLGRLSAGSTIVTTEVVGVTGPDIEANTITANNIVAGTLTVNELSPSVGDELNISANATVNIIVGRVDDVEGTAVATEADLAEMQTYYQFTNEGAFITQPGSPYGLALRNDRIEMLENGVAVSYWNAGQMFVDSLVAEKVVLGNHQLEKYGTGTVVRKI